MATNAANLTAALASLTAKYAEWAAYSQPTVMVDGVSVDVAGYLESLGRQIEATKKLLQQSQPFAVVSRARS